jgi:hypothetical protein
MVNSLRVWGREPLRSASRLLGFTIDALYWDPGHRLVAGSIRGPRCLQDPFCVVAPASFLGRVADRGPDALRLFPTAFSKGHHRRGCCRCCRSRPGNLADVPPHWGSANTSISDAGCITIAHKRYSRRNPIKQRVVLRCNGSPFVATAGRRKGCSGHELPCPEEPGQFILGCR